MFLAETRMTDRKNPAFERIVSFSCGEHSEMGLIQLIFKYQKLVNRLNGSDIVFQLLNLSSLGTGVSPTTISELGVVVLSNQILTDLKSRAMGNPEFGQYILLHPLDAITDRSESEPEFVDTITDYVYNLPALTKWASISELNVNTAVRDLFKLDVLFLSVDEDGKLFWVMLEKTGPDFVHYTKGRLEADKEAYIHYHSPTKNYKLTDTKPESVLKAQAELIADSNGWETIVKELTHLDMPWHIIKRENVYYARFVVETKDFGPFNTVDEAELFLTNITVEGIE